MSDKLTEKEFLARCKVAYRYGLGKPEIARLLRDWVDAVMRYEHTLFSYGQSQGRDWMDFLMAEKRRIENNGGYTLAGDKEGYALQEIAAVFAHPCQKCASDPGEWHTRSGFCTHRER